MTRFAAVPAQGGYTAQERVHARSVAPRYDRAAKAAAKFGGRVIETGGRLWWSGDELDAIPTLDPPDSYGPRPATGKPRRHQMQVRLDDDEHASLAAAVRAHNLANPADQTTASDWLRRHGMAAALTDQRADEPEVRRLTNDELHALENVKAGGNPIEEVAARAAVEIRWLRRLAQ